MKEKAINEKLPILMRRKRGSVEVVETGSLKTINNRIKSVAKCKACGDIAVHRGGV